MVRSYESGLTIEADTFVDLQTHTHLSDGDWIPEALIDHFVQESFATAAITDHDRVDTMVTIQKIAHERGFPLLVAAEMTTRWQNSLVDILCFGFEANPAPLQQLCDAIQQNQAETCTTVYKNLVNGGHLPQHNEAELTSITTATTSKQPHLLFDLFERHNPALEDPFSIMQKAGHKLCTNPTLAVVEAVHEAGGVALIAHPGRTDGFATFDSQLLDQFRAEIPIDGIEVYYPRHSAEQVALYKQYANEHDWLISAGSDSHASDKPPIKYQASLCKRLLQRLDFVVSS